jgi:hypothetical protein
LLSTPFTTTQATYCPGGSVAGTAAVVEVAVKPVVGR